MKHTARGFSLIELMIALAILGLLLALAAPNYSIWIANSKIRTTGEAIQNGLQLARGEAVRRNAQIYFTLTSSLGNDCVTSITVSNWVVSYDLVPGKCGNAMLNEAFPVTDAVNNPEPRMIQARPAAEGSNNVVLAASQSVIQFNGLGRIISPATNPVTIDVTNPVAGTCKAAGGALRCLRVTVTVGGQIRLCDPALPSTGTDPQRCVAAG